MKKRYAFIVLMGLWVFGAKCQIEQVQTVDSKNNEVVQAVVQQACTQKFMCLYPLAQKIQNFIKTHGYTMITLSCTLVGLYINYYFSKEQLACARASLAKSNLPIC